jgi:hypothetical protein
LFALSSEVAVGLEVERQAAEADADRAQAEALQEESNYHYFQNLTAIAEAAVARVRNEEKWQQGQGHLLPNFRTYADLYKDKEARQKALKEQLQKQKASIAANEPEAMEQRKLFLDLSKLLAAKVCNTLGPLGLRGVESGPNALALCPSSATSTEPLR